MELEGDCSKFDPEREVHQARPDRVQKRVYVSYMDTLCFQLWPKISERQEKASLSPSESPSAGLASCGKFTTI